MIFLQVGNRKGKRRTETEGGKEKNMARGKQILGLPKGKHLFGTVRVGEKGQIVIPKEARKMFGMEAGDTLLILGDESTGIIITRPDVMTEVAGKVFRQFDDGG